MLQAGTLNIRCVCPAPFGSRLASKDRAAPRDLAARASRADNRGNLRLYLDSASVYQWEKFAPREAFFGEQAFLPRNLT